MSSSEFCHVCAAKGKSNQLRVYQINFDEAVRFCEDDKCTYPVGQTAPDSIIVNRRFTDISSPRKKLPSLVNQQPHSFISTKRDFIPCSPSVKKILNNTINQTQPPSVGKILTPYIPGKSNRAQNDEYFANQSASACQGESIVRAKQTLFPQWQNKEALCWLDVVMCLLVHCKKLQENVKSFNEKHKSVLSTLLIAYSQACEILNSSRESKLSISKSMSSCPEEEAKLASLQSPFTVQKSPDVVNEFQHMSLVDNRVKTGAGMKLSSQLNLEHYAIEDRYYYAFSMLQEVRETVFEKLQPRLQCEKGKNDSPLFAIPLLVKGNSAVEKLMMMKYRSEFHCKACGYKQSDAYNQILPTIPKPPQNIRSAEPTVERSCFKCRAPWQLHKMVFEKLSDVVILHFVEGLQSNDIENLSFSFGGRHYRVRGLIQYLNNPDHFVTWIYDSQELAWMECDDLKSPVAQFQKLPLKVPAEQIHIVMWESSGMPDTKTTGSIKPMLGMEHRKRELQKEKQLSNSRKSLPADFKNSQKFTTKEKVAEASCRTENLRGFHPSALKPNMVVTLTHTGQIVQVPLESINPESQTPGTVPQSRNLPQRSASGTGLMTSHSNTHAVKEMKTLPTNPTTSPRVYTPNFLKSLLQRKSRKSIAVQAENKTEKFSAAVGGANTLSKVQGTSSTNFRAPFTGKKKFEGYFSHRNSKSDTSQDARFMRSASVSSMSGDSSRPSSPTLSSYSDTFTMKKRKKAMKESEVKRRKSISSNVSSPESLPLSQESLPLEEVIEIPTSEGCDVLQSLYSALNLTMPENSELSSSMKMSNVEISGDDFIPDVKDLADFIASPGNLASSNLDEFLAQL